MVENSIERAIKTLLIMPTCPISIMLITKNYINDYYNGDPEITTQVELSKRLNQPVILMLDRNLTLDEREEVESIFMFHKVVARIIFDRNNMQKCELELFEALKPYGAKKRR